VGTWRYLPPYITEARELASLVYNHCEVRRSADKTMADSRVDENLQKNGTALNF
jgi:hypothetical protein